MDFLLISAPPNQIPLCWPTALGLATSKIEFIIAYRSGLIVPTTFAQQINTLSTLVHGRMSLNIVAGHSPEEQGYYGDLLARPERYARTAEFLEACLALWRRNGPVSYNGRFYQLRKCPPEHTVRSRPAQFSRDLCCRRVG
jgi:alkanesulfonate monooxygenase